MTNFRVATCERHQFLVVGFCRLVIDRDWGLVIGHFSFEAWSLDIAQTSFASATSPRILPAMHPDPDRLAEINR
jgi:hypothetical protein